MRDLLEGGQLVDAIVDELNTICTEEGGITTDDARIWQAWLHRLTTEEWSNMMRVLRAVGRDDPSCINGLNERTIAEVEQALRQDRHRVMDTREYKGLAWRMLMQMREIINRYYGRRIVNSPSSRTKPAPKTLFTDLFTEI